MANRTPEESVTTPKERIPGLPKYGWRINLDFETFEKCSTAFIPRLSEVLFLVAPLIRYIIHVLKYWSNGRRAHLDYHKGFEHKPIYGCPIGGIGGGSIGRGYRGEFCRFQMMPGRYEHTIVQADAVRQLSQQYRRTFYCLHTPGRKYIVPEGSYGVKTVQSPLDVAMGLSSETGDISGPVSPSVDRLQYTQHVPEFKMRLLCHQISPIIPHDYKDSSFPMAAFIWTVENNSQEKYDVSIAFTFKNGTGCKDDYAGGCWNEPFITSGDDSVRGVKLVQKFKTMQCTYAIAVPNKSGLEASHCVQFNPQSSGAEIWDHLAETGHLQSTDMVSETTSRGKDIGAAVCLQCRSNPGSTRFLEFSLVWDMPIVQFGPGGLLYTRRYTKWFSSNNDAAPAMTDYCLKNYSLWEEKIETWQKPILSCSKLPSWYKALLFNELYYVSDGGTVWLNAEDSKSQTSDETHPLIKEYGRFAYLESYSFRLYNTYDVHFYASFALLMLWPKLQLSLNIDIGKAIMSSNNEPFLYCMTGEMGKRKTPNTTPHDMGEPENEPWLKVNAYLFLPTDDWKDLNSKFVLQVYMDYHATSDNDYLEHMYPIMKVVMETSLKYDIDNDGLIENGGLDQTYALWKMYGVSAYCGGLWLCALKMFAESAKVLGYVDDYQYYTDILNKAKESFDIKLWNGDYYNFDCSATGAHDIIMAGQLAGNWYMKAAGIKDETIFPEQKVRTALTTIFKTNVMGCGEGNMGAMNATRADGGVDTTSRLSDEFWTGVTYSLAAQLIQENMLEEAFQTAWGNYNVCWERRGFMFQSPESYKTTRQCRCLGYMRALTIWSMQWALEKYHPQLFKP